jgi:hypothetical protein
VEIQNSAKTSSLQAFLNLSTDAQDWYSFVVQESEVSDNGHWLALESGEQSISRTNKLSLNLLQDRLACESQLSLKGVIRPNIVVNFRTKSELFQSQSSRTHTLCIEAPRAGFTRWLDPFSCDVLRFQEIGT